MGSEARDESRGINSKDMHPCASTASYSVINSSCTGNNCNGINVVSSPKNSGLVAVVYLLLAAWLIAFICQVL